MAKLESRVIYDNRAVPECPERNYNLWRSVGLSRIPRLAENLLAA